MPASAIPREQYDPDCTRCPRLAAHLAEIRKKHPDYHALPVPPFGDPDAGLLIVGLAPGMHGANRSGRPFTGDYAGILLYRSLYEAGFASRPESVSVDDGLELADCRITNAVKCLPPQNKPTTSEIDECNPYLQAELATLGEGGVVLALGAIAHRAVLKALGLKQSANRFAHAGEHGLPGARTLL
ncbi:MAG TPA: uracil-DNA glycosylase, partial [Woeseiaceae bacterium]|nr:uracil-DNA glycosylase [Woeseiaceae bacterium]